MQETYRLMEETALTLIKSGSEDVIVSHLKAMASVAAQMGRPDLALLNIRTAVEIAEGAGLSDEIDGEFRDEIESCLRIPFTSIEQEIAVFQDYVRQLLRLLARKKILQHKLHPELRFEYEVTKEEFEMFLGGHPLPEDVECFSLARDCLAKRLYIALRSEATSGEETFFTNIFRRLYLSPIERDVVIAALMPCISDDFLRSYIRVMGDYTKTEPDISFLSQLVSLNKEEEREALLCFEEDAKLVSLGILILHNGGVPILRRQVRVAPFLVRLALGHKRPGIYSFTFPTQTRDIASILLEKGYLSRFPVSRHSHPIVMIGSDRDDLLALVFLLFGEGKPIFYLKSFSDPIEKVVKDAVLETLSFGGVLLVDLFGEPKYFPEVSKVLSNYNQTGLMYVVLLGDDPEKVDILGLEPEIIKVLPADNNTQTSAWISFLGCESQSRYAKIFQEITTRYPLSVGAIWRACAKLRQEGSNITSEEIIDIARKSMPVRSIRLCHQVNTDFGWGDLVLPDEVLIALNEVVTYYRYREQVYDRWGFRRKLPYGRALSALFHGPSGTGKTMAASVLANEFRVPLFQVNLASLVSKYVGETEKNLAMIFDDASRSRALLLFDEADSLFGKRTLGSTAIDRYSNLEVNYLLQRMEEFDGLVILTTNLESAIDPAFKRRIRFKIHFPAPDKRLRESLWRTMLQDVGEVSNDINFVELSQRFELVGGSIKNAVIRAAFAAAEEGSPITQRHLIESAMRECKESGQLVREKVNEE